MGFSLSLVSASTSKPFTSYLSLEVAKFQLLQRVTAHSAAFSNVLNCSITDPPSLFEQQIITPLAAIILYGIHHGTHVAVDDAVFRFIIFLVCTELRMKTHLVAYI